MCTPILIAGAALAVGSAVANSVQQGEQVRARDNVLAAERIRQNGYDQQATALNNQSQNRYVDFVPQQDARAASLGAELASRVAPDPNSSAGTVMPSSSSDVVNQEVGKQEGNAQAYVDQQSGALAKMKSFGDLLGEISTGQARDAGQIGQIGGFKTGSSNIVPLELDNASHAGEGWGTLADVLRGTGQIATAAGITGNNPLANMFAPRAGVAGAAMAGGAGAALMPWQNRALSIGSNALGVT